MILKGMRNANLEEMVMSFDVQIGDNFAVRGIEGNVEGVDFYVLQWQRPKFMICAPFCLCLGL
jgi:hypothetical protein